MTVARPTEQEIMPLIDGITYLWLRAPWNPAGYYFITNEGPTGEVSVGHWSERFDTFAEAEKAGKAEKKRAEERAKKKKR